MENPIVFLGIKVKPGPIERHKIENFTLDNTVNNLKNEAERKTNIPSASLELIHHGKILKDGATLKDSGIKNGEMVHVVRKKSKTTSEPPPPATDAELQQIVAALSSFGCTPNAPGWTRAMQVLNDESAMAEIMDAVPSLNEGCETLSILHEVELLAALGASLRAMRRGANARPDLPAALTHLIQQVRNRSSTSSTDNAPTSGFAYSLEALSEDEDGDDDDNEEQERSTITQDQLAAALQAATEAVASSSRGGQEGLLRLLRAVGDPARTTDTSPTASGSSSRPAITPEMFSEALTEAISRAGPPAAGTEPAPMEESTPASSSVSPGGGGGGGGSGGGAGTENFAEQIRHMHEMGLLDDALNLRALLICSGDVNAAINLVFSGAIGDD